MIKCAITRLGNRAEDRNMPTTANYCTHATIMVTIAWLGLAVSSRRNVATFASRVKSWVETL